jgi:hypothetical protein
MALSDDVANNSVDLMTLGLHTNKFFFFFLMMVTAWSETKWQIK